MTQDALVAACFEGSLCARTLLAKTSTTATRSLMMAFADSLLFHCYRLHCAAHCFRASSRSVVEYFSETITNLAAFFFDLADVAVCDVALPLHAAGKVALDISPIRSTDPSLLGCGGMFDDEAGLVGGEARTGKREQKK
jgi:hypothetical protein